MRYVHRLGGDCQTLELAARRAGSAWACSFANSDEYEAALIRERRAAGAYGSRHHCPTIFAIIAAVGFLLLFLVF